MPRFVVQQHDATTLHWDLRLEMDGVLKSWALPKGPSLDPAVKRLAVPVPDHSLAYGAFEGLVGMGGGSGAVIVWDRGSYELLAGSLDEGHFTFALDGEKLRGGFALTRWDERKWLLVKKVDADAVRGGDIVAERPESVVSGRTWEQLAD
jgi:DNA ligase D-like protein (predicted 3'-phosphoesterase)